MNYTTYDPTSGEILSTIIGSGESLIATLNNQPYVEGSYGSQDYYIDLNTLQPVGKSPRPNPNAIWDYVNKCWIDNTAKDIIDARIQRDLLLSIVDRVNPIWYGSLTSEQQQELATYRTQLLNVPQQTGFPNAIEWPTKPSCL